MADQQFCLRWNNHQSTLISVFDSLLENGTLVDCTLAAEGQYLKAHKVVLSACSPYLEALLSQHYEKHPIVILKDVKFTELKSMMDYMYRGEVNISQDQLGTFLKAAESLQIKGLSDNGSDGDGRDVGSTSKGPPGKVQPAPSNRPAESQRPELSPPSSVHRSRDGSISPSSRKRRRIRRNSQGDDANMGDSHLDSNSCDLPNQAQSTPLVPNIPATVTSSISATPIKATIVKPEQTELVNRIDSSNLNSLPPESGLLKEKIEPISEPLLEPKTEYLDETNNDDSVEDLTLDDDDEMDEMDISNMSNMSNISRPGPSHGNDVSQMSNQGFVPWQIGNQSGTDEVFMAAQEAVQAHRNDSQDWSINSEVEFQEGNSSVVTIEPTLQDIDNGLVDFDMSVFKEFVKDPNLSIVSTNPSTGKPDYTCPRCYKIYTHAYTLFRHLKFECGQQPKFSCPHCSYKSRRKDNIKSHVIAKHEKGKKIKCLYCEKTFVHKFRMMEHIRLFHNEEMISSLPVEIAPMSTAMDVHPGPSPSKNTSSDHNLYINQNPRTSTPKKQLTSKRSKVATVDLPTVITVPSEFPNQEVSPPTITTPVNNTPKLADPPEIKEESTLDITDTVDPEPAPDYSDVLRVIF